MGLKLDKLASDSVVEAFSYRYESIILKITQRCGFVVSIEFLEEDDLTLGNFENTYIMDQLNEYFRGRRKVFDICVQTEGTEFQKLVWAGISRISYGRTFSYSDLAKSIGRAKAIRAVGSACRANKVPIIVPCHRVVPQNGGFGEYVGGRCIKKNC